MQLLQLSDLHIVAGGGDRFYTAQPGFALHTIAGGQLSSHLCCVPACDHHGGPYSF